MNEMKPSGVAWIGEIPSDWSAGRFKTVLSRNDGGVWGDDPKDDGRDSVVFRSTEQTVDGRWRISEPALRDLRDISNKSNSLLAPGDLLITKSSGSLLHIGKTSLFEDNTYRGDCYYSNFMQRLRVSSECYPKFYWYVLNSSVARDQFEYLQNATIGLGNLSSESIGALRVPFPSMSEQKAIADRLDTETAKIDQAISLLQQELDTLDRLKKSVIHEAVTKGLDPTVPMKPSGVEWIGDIPESWECKRLKYVLEESSNNLRVGPFGSAISTDDYTDEGYWLYNQRCVLDQNFETNNVRIKPVKYRELSSFRVFPGDMLITTRGTIGRLAVVPDDAPEGVLHPCVIRFRINAEHLMPSYLKYVFNETDVAISQLSDLSNATTIDVVYSSNLVAVRIPIPSASEQHAIADYLDSKCETLDKALAAKRGQIEVLRKQRQSLVYEYVTGKRRVSEVN